ncbi:hypothetical protein K3495_g11221 [Podosphaera aphanis]|nr:hypothetical protein K3495_g11221 [Podosphaera aphanis]
MEQGTHHAQFGYSHVSSVQLYPYAQACCLTTIAYPKWQVIQTSASAGTGYVEENHQSNDVASLTEDSSVQFSLYLSKNKLGRELKNGNRDEAYWQRLLHSPHLNDEEKLLINLRIIEGLSWKDIEIAFNMERGTDMKRAALRMRMRRTIARMDKLEDAKRSNFTRQVEPRKDPTEAWTAFSMSSEMDNPLRHIGQDETKSPIDERFSSVYADFQQPSSEFDDNSDLNLMW